MFFALKVVVWIEIAIIAGWFLFQKTAARDLANYFDRRYLFILLAIPALAFFTPTLPLLYLIGVVIVPLCARSRQDAVLVYLVCLFVFPELESRLEVGPIYLITMTMPMALTIGLGCSCLILKGGLGRVNPAMLGAVLLFSAVLFLSAIRDGALPMRPVADIAIRTVLPFYLVARSVHSESQIRLVFAALVLVALSLGMLAIVESARNWPIYQEVYRIHGINLPISSARMIRGGVMRAPASFIESTSFAILLMMAFFVIVLSPKLARSGLHKSAMMAMLLLAMLAAVSRGAFLGAAIGLLAASLYKGQWQRAIGVAASACVALLALRAAAPYSTFLSGIFNTTSVSGAADYRVDLFNAGIDIVRQHPYAGISFSELNQRLSFLEAGGLVDFVNTYLFFAMTTGVAGFIVFTIYATSPGALILFMRQRLVRLNPEAGLIVAMSVSAALTFIFTSFWERNPYWLSLIAGLGSSIVAASKLGAPPKSQTQKAQMVADVRLPHVR